MRAALALLALAAVCYLPFFGFPEWRGTEARRVQIAVEMLETGDWIVPRLWEEETFAKPPLMYWILAGSFRVFGVHAWSARLPSVLAFWLLAVVAYRFLGRWTGSSVAKVGAIGILVSPLAMHDVPFAEIDPMFAAWTGTSLLCLVEGVMARRRGMLLVAGVLGGLAVMTKGPPYLMFFLGPLVLWWRHSRLRGWHWFLPGVVGFYLAYKFALDARQTVDSVGEVALQESLGRLEFWRLESLRGIPAHLVNFLVVVGLPLSFWLGTWWRQTRRSVDPVSQRQNFLVWGAISGGLVLVFSVDRASRYLLPAVPMLICGLAPLAVRNLRDESRPGPLVRQGASLVGVLAGLAVVAMPWVPHPYPGTTWLALVALGCVALVVHSRGQLVRFVLVLPLVIAWTAFPDRCRYAASAGDFVPPRAEVLARELQSRGIDSIATHGHVGTSILLATKTELGGALRIRADWTGRRPPTERWVVVVDRGIGERVVDLVGYRDVFRLQLTRTKSLSLRERM